MKNTLVTSDYDWNGIEILRIGKNEISANNENIDELKRRVFNARAKKYNLKIELSEGMKYELLNIDVEVLLDSNRNINEVIKQGLEYIGMKVLNFYV